jgi:DNA-binding protein YbaB
MTAKGEMVGVAIDRSLAGPDDIEVIEDLVKAAHADAKRKADEAQQGSRWATVTSGLSCRRASTCRLA